jgi:hypothetical protein
LFDSETDGAGSVSRPAFSFWSVAVFALVAVVTGAFVGAGIANRTLTVRSDASAQPPLVAVTALPSATHATVKLSLPFRSTTHAVQREPKVVVEARGNVSARAAYKRVAVRPVRSRAAATMTKAAEVAPSPVAALANLPIDAGPTLVVDEDTTPRSVTRVASASDGTNFVSSAPVQLSVAASALDPDGDTLTYRWSAPTGSFANADASRTTFTCPGKPAEVPLTVTVTDHAGGSASDTVIVRCVAPAPESSR